MCAGLRTLLIYGELANQKLIFKSRCQRGTAIFTVACPFYGTRETCRKRENVLELRESTTRLDGPPCDSEFANSLLESGSLHPKICCGPFRARHNPVALLQGFNDLLTFRLLQNVVECTILRRARRIGLFDWMADLGKFQISHIDVERRTRRDNDRALDHILEFSYVPRPMVPAQSIHRR
jgi:hypothetical protein